MRPTIGLKAGADSASPSNVRGHLAAALLALASSVLMTWPLALGAGHQVLRAIYYWDAYTNAMILGSRVDALLGRGPLSLYDDYFFAPLPHSIVFNENLFALSLLFAPFYLISHNGIWAYNLTLIVSLALSVFFTYLLVLRLTKSAPAGLIAGVAFAFCPFVLFEIGRIQLVATQWIPAAFLLLQRAIELQRRRDIIGFWLCALLQIGTCLYNAMFLLPLLGLVCAVLLVRQRPPLRFYYWFGGTALAAGALAGLMVYPYFAARHAFDLERSVAFASSYDGKFGFFGNVSETNRTLKSLRQLSARVGHEEIAFPGCSVLLLASLALAVPAWHALRRTKRAWRALWLWALLTLAAALVGLLGHSLLPSALVFGGGATLLARRRLPQPFAGDRGLYFAVLLLSVIMFLGFEPLVWNGAPVRGLYYYFHRYVPGFDGIRKVSRQALLVSFCASTLAGFGAAWLFARLRRDRDRVLACAALLVALACELRCFPHPIEQVWAGSEVPSVLRFVATLPARDLIAFSPQNAGKERFRGDAGMALYNYLALYTQHRFVNGQSSWQPAVTELARRALDRLPDAGARRALLAIGARHVVLFGEDLPPARAALPAALAARPSEYRRVFQQGADSVFTLLGAGDPSLELLPTRELPAFAKLVPQALMRGSASLQSERAPFAFDGRPGSYWSGARPQESGQYFEVQLSEPRELVALEITAPGRVMDVPVSYRLSAGNGEQDLGIIAEQSVLRFYRAQVFSPEAFVFRVLFPSSIRADRIRITVAEPVPGQYFTINELRLYEADSGL